MAQRIRIALGDLGHTTKLLANNMVPLNIGFISSYLTSQFGNDVDVRIFKDPARLLEYCTTTKPDLVAVSNYAWNQQIGLQILKAYKAARPSGVSVMGGPNFPKVDDGMQRWLMANQHVDFAVENEGEKSLFHLVDRLFGTNFDIQQSRHLAIQGCFFRNKDGVLVRGTLDMLANLDDIPSPYLSGLLDDYLLRDIHGTTLIPMIEGSRGCPFACTFCRAGIETNKIRTFSTDRVNAEIDYIARFCQRHDRHVSSLMITDQNFGIMRRDIEIADALRQADEKFGFPTDVMATTGKTNVKVVLETLSHYSGIHMTMSVQSMDDEVLANIKRKNFPVSEYQKYQEQLKARGQLSKCDVIVGLPGETKQSHLNTLRSVIDIGIDVIDPFTFMMLAGTEAEMKETRERYEYVTRWRLLPNGFSDLGGHRVFESEEVAVGTNTMAYEEYVYLRRIHLLLVSISNGNLFSELKRRIAERDLDFVTFLQRLEVRLSVIDAPAPHSPAGVLAAFSDKTEGELFTSREALETHFAEDDNFDDLINDAAGENLLQKHRYAFYNVLSELTREIVETAANYIAENGDVTPADESLFTLLQTRADCIQGLLNDKPVKQDSPMDLQLAHDFPTWKQNSELRLEDTALPATTNFVAYYSGARLEDFGRHLDDKTGQNLSFSRRPFEKARTLYRLGVERLMPDIVPISADASAIVETSSGRS